LLALGTLTGCVYYEPVPYGHAVAATFDRSWNAALGALQDQGVQIANADRAAGIIEGRRGNLTVKARVLTQADGRIRVEFNTGGNLSEDPGLSDRISRSYDVRMGR
jgi:hypothetical protein